MACRARRRARDLLRAGTPARPAGAVGLHGGRRAGHQPWRTGLPAPAVPVCAGLQRLAPCAGGAGWRELPEPGCGAAGGAVDGRGRAPGASHRQSVGGLQQPGRTRGADHPLPEPVRALRHAPHAQQHRRQPRERRHRGAPGQLEARPRPGPAAARQPRVCQLGGLRAVRGRDGAPAQRPLPAGLGSRTRLPEAAARTPHGRLRRDRRAGQQVRCVQRQGRALQRALAPGRPAP